MPASHPTINGKQRGSQEPCVGDCSLLMYAAAGRPTIVGEWSLATNMDARIDISRPEVAAHLGRLYREQLDVFARSPAVMGAFFWTLRMGSGWNPRPTDAHPHGQQLDGTSAWRSKPGYPFPLCGAYSRWPSSESPHRSTRTTPARARRLGRHCRNASYRSAVG